MSRAVVLTMLLALASPVWAQSPGTGAPTPDKPPVETEKSAGDLLWERANAELQRGTPERAVTLLEALVDSYPEHPKFTDAVRLLDAWRETLAEAERQKQRSRARARLAAGQALHGVAVGLEAWHLAVEFPFADSNAAVATGMAAGGAVVGTTAALLLTPNGIEPGHAGLLNTAPIWGAFVGYTASRTNYGIRDRGRIVTAMVGQGVGFGLGHLAWHVFEPTYGQTWVVDSAAFWTTALATTTLLGIDPDNFPRRRPILAGLHVWSATVGLVGGGFLASTLPNISAGRVMLINLTGALSGVLAVMFSTVTEDVNVAIWSFNLATPVGLGLGAFLTRNMNKRPPARREPMLSLGMTEFTDGTRGIALGGRF